MSLKCVHANKEHMLRYRLDIPKVGDILDYGPNVGDCGLLIYIVLSSYYVKDDSLFYIELLSSSGNYVKNIHIKFSSFQRVSRHPRNASSLEVNEKRYYEMFDKLDY